MNSLIFLVPIVIVSGALALLTMGLKASIRRDSQRRRSEADRQLPLPIDTMNQGHTPGVIANDIMRPWLGILTGRMCADLADEIERAIQRERDTHADLLAALKPFAALVHDDGINAPYPMDEGAWPERFRAAAAAIAKAEGRG